MGWRVDPGDPPAHRYLPAWEEWRKARPGPKDGASAKPESIRRTEDNQLKAFLKKFDIPGDFKDIDKSLFFEGRSGRSKTANAIGKRKRNALRR
jgi:hypothetical protein